MTTYEELHFEPGSPELKAFTRLKNSRTFSEAVPVEDKVFEILDPNISSESVLVTHSSDGGFTFEACLGGEKAQRLITFLEEMFADHREPPRRVGLWEAWDIIQRGGTVDSEPSCSHPWYQDNGCIYLGEQRSVFQTFREWMGGDGVTTYYVAREPEAAERGLSAEEAWEALKAGFTIRDTNTDKYTWRDGAPYVTSPCGYAAASLYQTYATWLSAKAGSELKVQR